MALSKQFRDFLKDADTYRTYLRLGFIRNGGPPVGMEEFGAKYPKSAWLLDKHQLLMDKVIDPALSPYYRFKEFLTHVVFAKPETIVLKHLKNYEWHDADTKMMHAAFTMLVDFVEIDVPSEADFFFTERKLDFKYGRRYPEIAVEYLTANARYNHNYQVLFLYEWWTKVYVPRWNSWHDETDDYYTTSMGLACRITGMETPDPNVNGHYGSDPRTLVDAELNDWKMKEEQDMLLELVKIRASLWS